MTSYRRAFTIKDLAMTLTCVAVAGVLLMSQFGAVRTLSEQETCANNLRQMFTGLTAYVNQYNSYPPNAPYPTYMAPETINGVSTMGWDPSIGWILTYGLGIQPPATDTATGHFKWYGTAFADLPDVCKCPAMPAAMLDPSNPELSDPTYEGAPLETLLYQYALSYQTSGTCRAACPIKVLRNGTSPGQGGRNPAIPDPRAGSTSGQMWDNCAARGSRGVGLPAE